MNIKQYIRLCLVLFFPLLIAGWWIAESEFIYPQNIMVSCVDAGKEFSCSTSEVTRKELLSHKARAGKILVGGAAFIYKFNYKIQDYTGFSANLGADPALLPGRIAMLYPGPDDFCYIDRVDEGWMYDCGLKGSSTFVFSDPRDHDKFEGIKNKFMEAQSEHRKYSMAIYVISFCMPFVIFFGLSLIVFAIVIATRFVIGRKD